MILRVQPDFQGNILMSLEDPTVHPQHGQLYPFTCRPSEPEFQALQQRAPGVVRTAGEKLYAELMKHPAVQSALTVIAGAADPVYVHCQADEAEDLPWEALRNQQNQYLALHGWPIARVADTGGPPPLERAFEPPVRVLAIFGAANVDARPEWDALYVSVAGAPVGMQIHALVAQDALFAHLTSLADPRISVEYLSDAQTIVGRIEEQLPNVLHIFSHGSTSLGPHLQITTRAEWESGADAGTIRLEAASLQNIRNLHAHLWLITLNCCLGAKPTEHGRSMARALATMGIPAVVGMRETIATTDAHLFCQTLYGELVKKLHELSNPGVIRMEVQWPDVLMQPRLALRNASGAPGGPDDHKEWTLPVLYLRRVEFPLRTPSTNAALSAGEKLHAQVTLTELRRLRAEQSTRRGVVPAMLQTLDQNIQALEQTLYP